MEYYNVNEAVSRNRPLNFIVGARGVGKTYGFKKYLINRFIKHGEMFIYLRQTQREIDNIADFWGSLPERFPKHKFKQRGKVLFIDKQRCGELHALSEYVQLKSNEYPKVRYIVFDEFLDDSPWMSKVEKPYALASIIDTVFRNRDGCKVFCLANAENLMNTYFEYFGIYPKNKKGVTLTRDIALEVVDGNKYHVTDTRANNWLGRVTSGTDYADMAQSNQFKDDNENHVKPLPAGAELLSTVIYQRDRFDIFGKNAEVYFVQSKENHKTDNVQVFTIKDAAPGMDFWRNNINLWRRIKQAAETGQLYFDDKRTREICYVFLKQFVNIK